MVTTDEVNRDETLWQKLIPEVKWKVSIYVTEARNGIIIEGENDAFNTIAMAKIGWCQPEVNILCFHKLL